MDLARSGFAYLEVIPKEISKQTAVERLGVYFGVSREGMAAFGDSFVDLKLLQYAGLGIAMGNAPQEVKEAIGWVADSNDEERIYITLQHLRFSAPEKPGPKKERHFLKIWELMIFSLFTAPQFLKVLG